MNHLIKYYEKSEANMPLIFSGNQFVKDLASLGISRRVLNNTSHTRSSWLSLNCDRVGKRLYRRRSKQMTINDIQIVNDEAELQKAITLIKSKGGKVFMPTTEYKEI